MSNYSTDIYKISTQVFKRGVMRFLHIFGINFKLLPCYFLSKGDCVYAAIGGRPQRHPNSREPIGKPFRFTVTEDRSGNLVVPITLIVTTLVVECASMHAVQVIVELLPAY